MRLNDSLFRITRTSLTDDAHYVYDIRLDADHLIYRAHFPGHPITPGVVILQTALELKSLHDREEREMEKVNNLKFIAVVDPRETPSLTYSFTEKAGKTLCLVTHDGQVFAKLSFTLKDNHTESCD